MHRSRTYSIEFNGLDVSTEVWLYWRMGTILARVLPATNNDSYEYWVPAGIEHVLAGRKSVALTTQLLEINTDNLQCNIFENFVPYL